MLIRLFPSFSSVIRSSSVTFLLCFREETFITDSDKILIDSILSENLSESNTQTNQLCQTTFTTSANIHNNVTDKCNLDNDFLSFEELMDFLPLNAGNVAPTYAQTDRNINTVSNDRKHNQ